MVGVKRFIALSTRLPAYQSVLAARMAAEAQPESAQAAAPATQAADEVTPEALNLVIPGLIERVEV